MRTKSRIQLHIEHCNALFATDQNHFESNEEVQSGLVMNIVVIYKIQTWTHYHHIRIPPFSVVGISLDGILQGSYYSRSIPHKSWGYVCPDLPEYKWPNRSTDNRHVAYCGYVQKKDCKKLGYQHKGHLCGLAYSEQLVADSFHKKKRYILLVQVNAQGGGWVRPIGRRQKCRKI